MAPEQKKQAIKSQRGWKQSRTQTVSIKMIVYAADAPKGKIVWFEDTIQELLTQQSHDARIQRGKTTQAVDPICFSLLLLSILD